MNTTSRKPESVSSVNMTPLEPTSLRTMYWTPTDAEKSKNTLIYVLWHKSDEAAKQSWDAFRKDPDGIADFVDRELPWGRFGTVDEVADVVAFLASERASWVVGTCVVVDGGQSRAF